MGPIPGRRIKIPCTAWHGQKVKEKRNRSLLQFYKGILLRTLSKFFKVLNFTVRSVSSELRASPSGSVVKKLPIMQMWVQSLGWEDSLQKEMATQSSILAWEIPWTKEPGGLQSWGHKSQTQLSDQTTIQNLPDISSFFC